MLTDSVNIEHMKNANCVDVIEGSSVDSKIQLSEVFDFHQNNRWKIWLLQCYGIFWITNIDTICIFMVK